MRGNSIAAAVRLIDRAWRTAGAEALSLAPIFVRLLSLEDRDPDAVLRLVERVDTADADIVAMRVHACMRLRRPDEAMQVLSQGLRQLCLADTGLLAFEASAALGSPQTHAVGWVGLTADLRLVGELAAGIPPESLEIRLDDIPLGITPALVRRGGRTGFSFQPLPGSAAGTLHLLAGGLPLLGSGRRLAHDFGLDGRTDGNADEVTGWVRIGWLPSHPVILSVEDEDGRSHRLKTRRTAMAGYRWAFRFSPRRAGLRGSRLIVSARLPDGRWQPLPDAPLLLPRALRIKGAPGRRLPRWNQRRAPTKPVPRVAARRAPRIDIVIPVYAGRQESLACIDSVLATIGAGVRVVVVDDATEDVALAAALERLAATARITLLRNERNLGFVRSVNRALATSAGRDVVLLNSDALVFDDWLQRLRATAYGGPRVGTVTPLSNDASIASYPQSSGSAVEPAEAAAIHRLAAWTHPGAFVEAPVGVGFCMYMRHDCLRSIGELDASVFGLGYGEETDFCMRAAQRGWSHRIAADVFVFHSGGVSFGARRQALLHRSQRLMNLRYPGYDRYIGEFLAQDPLRTIRRRLDERRLQSFEGRFVLLVTLALEGGVERYVAERGAEVREQGFVPLYLKPCKPGDRRHCELWTDGIDVPNLQYEIPADLPAFMALLRRLPIEEIEISHFLHLDPRVIDAVRGLGIPYDVVLHDYAWVCPRITLIDGSGRYCNEPEVSVCRSCVRSNGSQLGETITVPALRARSAAWLGSARRVVAPSADAATRLGRYFTGVSIEARPHADAQEPVQAPATLIKDRAANIRVALIGAIGLHKGYDILLGCARDARARGLALEFVVIGFTRDDSALLRTGRVFVTGQYAEVEVPRLLRRERPDIAFLPSVWPETWCYTLDHAMQAGLPVVAFDLGAIAERLRAAGQGVLLPLETTPQRINDRIIAHFAEERIF